MLNARRIQFWIEKIENNTFQLSQIKLNDTSYKFDDLLRSTHTKYLNDSYNFSSLSEISYDSSGAAKYIVVVVLVYGFAIILFIGSQIRSTKKFSADNEGLNAEKIMRTMQTDIFTKEVLEKLMDQNHRDRAWKIYLSESNYLSKQTEIKSCDVSTGQNDQKAIKSIKTKVEYENEKNMGKNPYSSCHDCINIKTSQKRYLFKT